MKKILLCLILFIAWKTIFAQCWANPGATWFYDYSTNYTEGYIKIQRTGDTIISGHDCDKLSETIINYDVPVCCPQDTVSYLHYYTYISSDTVYLSYSYSYSNFHVLCAYSTPKDSIMPNSLIAEPMRVDSATTLTMFNRQMRILYVSKPGCYSTWVMDKIGYGYQFIPYNDCNTPNHIGAELRCYYDETGIYYSNNIVPYCDYTSHDTYSDGITIYPDPSGISLSSDLIVPGTHIDLYDVRGRLIYAMESTENNTAFLPIETISGAVYLVRIESGDKSKQKKFFVN